MKELVGTGTVGGIVVNDRLVTGLEPARYGDSSGVRGVAWLWPEND